MLDIEELRWCSSFLEADFKFEKYTLYYSTLPFLNFLAISFLLSDAYLLINAFRAGATNNMVLYGCKREIK